MVKYILVDPITRKMVVLIENTENFPELDHCVRRIRGLTINFITDDVSKYSNTNSSVTTQTGLVSNLFNIPMKCIEWNTSYREHTNVKLLYRLKNIALLRTTNKFFEHIIHSILGRDHSIDPISRMIWRELINIDDSYKDRYVPIYKQVLMKMLTMMEKFYVHNTENINVERIDRCAKNLLRIGVMFSVLYILSKILRKDTTKLTVVYMNKRFVTELYYTLLALGFKEK